MTTAARQIELHVAAVFEPRDTVEARLIRGPGDARSLWFPAEKLADEAPRLAQANAERYNVYVGVNPRLAVGRRGNAGVHLARVVVADFDDTTVDAARVKLATSGLPDPTLVIDSGHGVHVYWRLSEPLPAKLWREWQKDLAALLGSDPSIHNEERILRLPGFTNHKPPAAPCRVVECAAARVYDLADLPIPMRPGSDTPAPVFRLVRHRDDQDGHNRVDRCRAYLAKLPPSVSGQYGHTTTWEAANWCNRFGLTKAEALEVMAEYSQRCLPPWSEKEIAHKVDDCYSRNAGQHGGKLREERAGQICPAVTRVYAVRRIAGAA
jgi:hypothetical protein